MNKFMENNPWDDDDSRQELLEIMRKHNFHEGINLGALIGFFSGGIFIMLVRYLST